jgi:anti-anti-sigma factor
MIDDHLSVFAGNGHTHDWGFFALEEIQGVDRMTLRCSGELDLETSARLESHARRGLDRRCGAVTLDLRELTFMDCRGLGVLLELELLALEGGWRFDVSHARGSVRRLFELTEVADRLTAA